MKRRIAFVASAMLACGGKTDGSSGGGDPGDPSPASTEVPAPSALAGTPPTSTPRSTGTTPMPAGTTPPPWMQNDGGTIAFEPTLVSATRYTNICGVMNPPFMNGDLYSLDVVDQTGPTPYNALSVSFSSPAPATGTALILTVQPFMPMGTGISQLNGPMMWYASQAAQGSGVSFQYSHGANPSEIDTGAFDAVTITILAMPTAIGQPLTIRIQMHFVDGKTFDETFSNDLPSTFSGCPRG